MNIESIKDKFDNAKTFANMKSYIKRINEALDLTPVTYLHEHIYVERFDELCKKMIETQQVRSKPQLVSRLQFIVSLIAKFDPSKSQGLRLKVLQMRNNNNDDLPTTVTIQDCPPWFEMLEMFQYEIDNNPRREAKIISVCFKHGYTLNLIDIFNTSTSASFPDREHNVLDLANHTWTISDKRNVKRTIDVSPAFVEEISKYIEIKDFWLLYKTTGMPYSTCLLSSIGIDAFKSNDVRNSWEIYQREKSQPEPEPEPEHSCEPHPLHIENPDKYTVSGKIRVVAKPKSLIVTDTMEVWSSELE